MPGPRTNAAFYAASVEEFLAASEEEVYAPLASPHGYTLAPEQQSAWRLQLPVLRAALEEKGTQLFSSEKSCVPFSAPTSSSTSRGSAGGSMRCSSHKSA